MAKKKLLFVAKGNADCDEGFLYSMELAKSIDAGIRMLVVFGSWVAQEYEDIMSAVAFAEAGEHETVKEMMGKEKSSLKDVVENKMKALSLQCRNKGVDFDYTIQAGDAVSVLKGFIAEKPDINMVVLSPNITSDSGGRSLTKKLLKSLSKPVVTISRYAGAFGRGA